MTCFPSPCSRWSSDLRGWRRLPFKTQKQGRTSCHAASRIDSRALQAIGVQQSGSDHLAQDSQCSLRGERQWSGISQGNHMNRTASSRTTSSSYLMERKPGGYRSPSLATRILSVIPADQHKSWFQQIWTGVTGASTKLHPAPYPLQLAERLIRMFSFVGDIVLDPFMGTGTTNIAAAKWGRNSIGVEVDSA